MKKVLIVASAMIFLASTTVLASVQSATGKVQPQKSTATTRQEPQKPAVKAEVKTPAMETKATASTKAASPEKKHHKGHGNMKHGTSAPAKENKSSESKSVKSEKTGQGNK